MFTIYEFNYTICLTIIGQDRFTLLLSIYYVSGESLFKIVNAIDGWL